MGLKSRQKGKRGEREAAKAINALLGCNAKRGQQRSGVEVADIVDGIPCTHLECKLYRKIGAIRFLEQAERDAKASDVPVVIMREDNGSWCVMCRLSNLPELSLVVTKMLLERVK
jgi:hypothetical protein